MSKRNQSSQQTLDVIVPVFNEEAAIHQFHQLLIQTLDTVDLRCRIIYVNDGSSDGTQAALQALAQTDERITVVELSRNFGHQAALTAGMDLSNADYTVTLDGDGQHPPALITEMLALARQGYDIVLTQRVEAQKAAGFKRWTSEAFYRLINRMGETRILPGGADFRLLSRTAVAKLKTMREYHRFLRGMVAWMGFKTVILPFTPPARLAGNSKYSLRKMIRLGMNAIFSFSLMPLYAAVTIGGIFLLLALAEAVYVLSFWVTGNTAQLAPGWSSLMFMLLIIGGSLMVTLGLIGIYIGYIFQEVKGRPIYLVRTKTPASLAGPHETTD